MTATCALTVVHLLSHPVAKIRLDLPHFAVQTQHLKVMMSYVQQSEAWSLVHSTGLSERREKDE